MTDTPTFHVPDPPDAYTPDERIGPPRWSAIAITGFILSFLLVLAPLGVLLGIAGIFRTRGGRRRGMGLAIAAIPIGLIVSLIVGVTTIYSILMIDMQHGATHVGAALRASSVTVAEKTEGFYEHFPQFASIVPRDTFGEWLGNVVATNGSMTSWKPAQPIIEAQPDGSWTFHFTGSFVNGSAHVTVTFFVADWRAFELRDIAVDGVSVASKSRSPAAPGS